MVNQKDMAELQTASAICGIVRTTWHTIEFIKATLKAQRNAQLLWHRTKTVYQLVLSLDAVFKLRQQGSLPGAEPLKERIVLITEAAAKNCQEVLDDLAQKCFALGARNDLKGLARLKGKVAYTLSAKEIHDLEQNMLSAESSVQTALALLNGVDGVDTMIRLKRIESMMERVIAEREQPTSINREALLRPFQPRGPIHTRHDSGIGLQDDEHVGDIEARRAIRVNSELFYNESSQTVDDIDEITPLYPSTTSTSSETSTTNDLKKFEDEISFIFSNVHRLIGEEKLCGPDATRAKAEQGKHESGSVDLNQRRLSTDHVKRARNQNYPSVRNEQYDGITSRMDEKQYEEIALHTALECNDLEAARALIHNGVDVDALSPETPLFFAVNYNKTAFVDLLVSAGANTSIVDEHGWSLVHYAVDRNCEDALNALLRRTQTDQLDLDVDARCEMDWTPLMHLAQTSCRPENIKLATILLDHGADVNATDEDGYSALWYAVQGPASSSERNRFVRMLLNRKETEAGPVRKHAPKRVAAFSAFKQLKKSSTASKS